MLTPLRMLCCAQQTTRTAQMPRGESLLDELQQAEYEAADVEGSSNEADAHSSSSVSHARITAASPLSSVSPAIDVPVPSVVPAHTPLAKYLTRISNGDAGAEAEADTRETTEEAADDHIEDEGDLPQTDDAAAQSASPSSSLTLLASLALEILAPAVCSCFLPRCTLAARSKLWCIQMLTTAAGAESASLNPSTALHKQQRALHAQISSQLSRIRSIYLGSHAFALLQSSFCGLQLLWLGMQQLGLHLIVPLLLGSSASHSALSVAGTLWPFVCLLLLLLALLNIAAALGNLRSSTAWHSLLVSAGACIAGPAADEALCARFESQTKSLILQLMERELVKRGYQLSGSSNNCGGSSGSSKGRGSQPQGFVPIERMDAASMRAGNQQQQQEDGSTRIRSALRDMFQQQSRQLLCMHRQILQIAAELDAFAPSAESAVDPSAAFPESVASSSLPSIVQLKSLRSEWIHARSLLVAAFLALLARLRLSSLPAPRLLPLRNELPIEAQLARAFLQLRIALAGHLATMDTLLPSSSPASALPVAAEVELPASRRALQQALCDVHNSIRSADRRLQIALERQARTQSTGPAAVAEAAPTKQRQGTGLLDQIRSELFPPRMLPDLGNDSSAASPAAPSAVAPWTPPLSSSFSQDVAYLRTLLVQLHRHCDSLDSAVKNVDADAGLDPDALAQGAQKPTPSAEILVSQNDDAADSNSSSASAADANLSQSELLAAMMSMRQRKQAQTPAGMGAVFEGSGAFADPPLRPRPRAAPATATSAAPAVSIFTILSELKSVLHNRPQAYEYVVHNREVTTTEVTAATAKEEWKHSAND